MANVNPASEIAALFRRDLTRLSQELHAFPRDEPALWQTLPGITNSAGHLFVHLEGNLREFIGRHLGNRPCIRRREEEFTCPEVPWNELAIRIDSLISLIPDIVAALEPGALAATHPQTLRGVPLSTHQFLIHTLGHLQYHLGQIDYLRRILLAASPLDFAGL